MLGSLRVLLVDDHALFREGVEVVLQRLAKEVFVRQAGSCEEALEIIEGAPAYDMILLDLGLPKLRGAEAFEAVLAAGKGAPVVLLTADELGSTAHDLLSRGARGYVPKSSSARVLVAGLQLVLEGGTYIPPSVLTFEPAAAEAGPELTARQRDVLREIARGSSNREIGAALSISEATVRVHVSAILRALKVDNRTQAACSSTARALLDED